MSLIGSLVIILVSTTFFNHLFARMSLPGVLGQLIAGIVIGPAILSFVHPSENLNEFAEIGVILLMFMAGIESNLDQLKKYLKPALAVALAGVILPVLIMGGISFLFGYHFQEALFIGVVFSATSVSISVVVLREFNQLESREGATILGAAVADDIIGVLLLSLMIALIGGNQTAPAGGQKSLIIQLLFQALFFVGVYLLVKWIAPAIMKLTDQLLVPTSRTICAMIICLSMAFLADEVGLSGAIGAFFAGIAVGQTTARAVVDQYIEPIGNAIFVPVFFANIGLELSFSNFFSSLPFIILMTLLAVLTKWFGGAIGARLTGFDQQSSQIVGTGMIARGEMALITAQIGFSAKLLAQSLYVDLILVIVLATLIAPLLLRWSLSSQKKF